MSCPRCGGKSKIASNPQGRCAKCLAKLKANKKNPNRWEHANKLADDALRRQKGKNGTATKKNKDLGTRKEIIRKVKEGYKKNGKGQILSPDRIDNSKGYGADNVRMVPKNMNRGDRAATKRKVKRWQHGLQKSEICLDEFATLVLAKAEALGIADFDIDLMKAAMVHDKDAVINIIADSEDLQAEGMISFVEGLTDDQLTDILI